MILLPPVTELMLIGVADRGIANKERIILRAAQSVDISPFALLVGVNLLSTETGPTQPLDDHFYWFGDTVVEKDTWIFVYTGQGESIKTTLVHSDEPAYVLHWGKTATLFARSMITPMLVRIGGMAIVRPPENQPQIMDKTLKGDV